MNAYLVILEVQSSQSESLTNSSGFLEKEVKQLAEKKISKKESMLCPFTKIYEYPLPAGGLASSRLTQTLKNMTANFKQPVLEFHLMRDFKIWFFKVLETHRIE